MFRAIVPNTVQVVAVSEELSEDLVFSEELTEVASAVVSRRQEYVTGRACAHLALERLGVPAMPILGGARGEPCWPRGVVGSITHCSGFRACAVGRAAEWAAVGIDAERNEPLPTAVIEDIAVPAELVWLQRVLRGPAPKISWDRLLFCAKEAIYKAWYPQMRAWLGFHDATVCINCFDGSFTAKLSAAKNPPPSLATIRGRWHSENGLLATAVVCPRVCPTARCSD